jgi:hypothetical protein
LKRENQAKNLRIPEVSDDIQKECSYLEKMKGFVHREDVNYFHTVKRLTETINVNSDVLIRLCLKNKSNMQRSKAIIVRTEVVESGMSFDKLRKGT